MEQERQAHLRREAKAKDEAEDLGRMLANVTVTITQKAGENGQLFGSVTAKDIADALEQQNYTIDRRKIQLDEPIKNTGEYKVPVRLHREVTAESERKRRRRAVVHTVFPPSKGPPRAGLLFLRDN